MMFQVDQLHTLVVVVEEGTFEAAAQRLRITASAVSQRIKAMEQAAGQILLQRLNPVQPTEAGMVVLRYGRQVQLLDGDTARQLSGLAHSAGDHISLPLAVNGDCLSTWFLGALAGFPRAFNAVFDIHREDQEHTTALLRSGAVMAAVTSTAEAVQGCTATPLGIMRYRAVCSPDFASEWLDDLPAIDRLDVAPLVTFDRKDDLQHQFYRGLTGRDLHAPRHFIPTSDDFARAIVQGFGWGVLPEQQCSDDIAAGTLVDIAPHHAVDVLLYWQRWNLASPLLDEVTRRVTTAAVASLHSAR
ncbi:LysR family transcriptional regulator [Glaciihabitans tibetensis]|uniref:LysR family transcriptional regulator n=1 Tax=Glaciihabitans tibetensis TaxID=1266600 RepID=A0A2T0VGQ6_9MICO|nr:LysR family transcriptional regulator ArgP [Glaciihabitans tibetensis]PRY69394.1 LysR family transcriptional regulator [Glaciihabitans tibetensis]